MDYDVRRVKKKYSGAAIRDSALRLVCEEAAYWYVRCTDETLTLKNRSELLRWLRENPQNLAELVRIGVYGRKLRKANLAR